MSYTLYKAVVFGVAYASLASVGYRLYNADGSASGSRITAGVSERPAATGNYGASVTVPEEFQGEIRWDTGGGSPIYASDEMNTESDIANMIEAGLSERGALRLALAVLAGKVSGGGTTVEVFRNALADSKPRLTANTDASGNRTNIVWDVS